MPGSPRLDLGASGGEVLGGRSLPAAFSFALRDVFDELDQLVAPVALLAREADEVAGPRDHRALLGRAGDGDTAPAPELEHPLVAQKTKRAQHGVRVHAEDGGEVAGRRQSLARLRLAVRDRP